MTDALQERSPRPPQPHGVLLVDKPAGMSSFDVLRELRRVFRTKKMGHAGTLDPFATGLLVVCFGDYTRFAGYLTDDSKEYVAGLRLGERTTTDDCDGDIVASAALPSDWAASLEAAIPAFRGTIQQVPPIYSAIHVDGQRAYALARKGEDVELEARTITVESLDIVGWTEQGASLFVRASKGTYIRSLARDLGEVLGVGGHLDALRRVRSGAFSIEEAHTLDALQVMGPAAAEVLIQGADALRGMPVLTVDADDRRRMLFGQTAYQPEDIALGVYALFDQEGVLLGVGEVEPLPADHTAEDQTRWLRARRLLPTAGAVP